MKNITDKEEFLLILKKPMYGKIKAACLEHLGRYPKSVDDIKIYATPISTREFAVDILAKDEETLDELHEQFRQSIFTHVGDALIHATRATQDDDGMWTLRYFILSRDPNLPWPKGY